MATIGDVARAAGVSRSTVSYALSGKRSISDETRDRINAAIDELGFTVNAGARALATAQTRIVALHVRFHSDEFAPAMMQYVVPLAEALRESGYDLLMTTDADGPGVIRRVTSSRMVDGLILLDVVDDDDRVAALRAIEQPAVVVGLPSDHEGLDVVDLDFEASARMVIDRLADAGHRTVLLVTPPADVFARGGGYAVRFRDAAVAAAAEAGLELRVAAGTADEARVHDELAVLLDGNPGITALIVHNDAIATALPSVLRERGVAVPDQLSVVSLFSESFARLFRLGISAVDTSPERIARLAAEKLVRRIAGSAAGPVPTVSLVAPVFVDRGSVAPPR